MVRWAPRDVARSVGKLPRNKETALAANLHSGKALVKAGNQASIALRKDQGLHVHLRLSIGSHHRLAVFAHHRRLAVGIRIELLAGCRKITRVIHVVELVGLSVSPGTNLDVLKAQGEIGFDDAVNPGDRGGQLQPPIGGGAGSGL